jgi:hypothetical protein
LQEVRRLEKLRQKRAFEASLPPIDDAERLPERQALIEAWEANEWAEREEEIKGLQDERLALLEQALQVQSVASSDQGSRCCCCCCCCHIQHCIVYIRYI